METLDYLFDYAWSDYCDIIQSDSKVKKIKMPEASKSNIHGPIHGNCGGTIYNTRGVEELQINK